VSASLGCATGLCSIVEQLLVHGADVNAVNAQVCSSPACHLLELQAWQYVQALSGCLHWACQIDTD
jgi:hypothetical protein